MGAIVADLANASLQVAALIVLLVATRAVLRDRVSPTVYAWGWWLIALRLVLPVPIHTGWAVASPRALLGVAVAAAPTSAATAGGLVAAPSELQLVHVLCAIWALGAVATTAAMALHHCRIRSVVSRAEIVVDETVRSAWAEASADPQWFEVELRSSAAGEGPFVTGLLRPVVIIPHHLVGTLTRREWTQVFGHELAHVRRLDLWQGGLWGVALAIHWVNPLVWLAWAAARQDRELAADAACAIRRGGSAIELGRTLLRIAEVGRPARSWVAASLGANSADQLKRRIVALARRPRNRWGSAALGATVGLGSVAAFAEPPQLFATLDNADLERGASSAPPPGWLLTGASADLYRATIDASVAHGGRQSARLQARGTEHGVYATFMSGVAAAPFHGQKIRITAYVRGQDIAGRGDFWARVQARDSPADGPGLGAGRCGLAGSFGWTPCVIEIDVPPGGYTLEFGLGLGLGPGIAWVDDVSVQTLSE